MSRALLLAALLAVLPAGCGTMKSIVGGGDEEADAPAELEEIQASLQVQSVWEQDVGAGTGGRELNLVPAVDGERVFAADGKGQVSAFAAADGRELWSTDIDAPISAGPGAGDALVLVGTQDGEVVALAQDGGERAWRAQLSSEVLAVPQAAGGVVVARTIDGKLFGLNTQSGRRLWTYDRSVPVLTLRGTSTPVISGKAVLNGFDEGRLVAVALADGKPLWETRISVPSGRSELERMVDIDASPVVVGDSVYVVSYQGRVAGLDLFSGQAHWQRDMSSHAGLDADALYLYVSDDQSHVWALDRYNSASVWRQTKLQGRQVTGPAQMGDYVVVGDFEGYVHWMHKEDGRLVARQRIDGAGYDAAPVAGNGMLYVYGRGGTLAALRPAP